MGASAYNIASTGLHHSNFSEGRWRSAATVACISVVATLAFVGFMAGTNLMNGVSYAGSVGFWRHPNVVSKAEQLCRVV